MVALWVSGCTTPDPAVPAAAAESGEPIAPEAPPAATSDAFQTYLTTGIPPADGFDFPVGDRDGKGSYTDAADGTVHHGWYVATTFCEHYSLGIHPGEDWNGRGGGNTDLGQPVYAAGAGKVIHAGDAAAPWGGVVVLEHLVYDNHRKRRLQTVYVHLDRIDVQQGDLVARRQQVGTIGRDADGLYLAHLHFEIRTDTGLSPTYWPIADNKDEAWVRDHYEDPTAFISTHRQLPVPGTEPVLLLVDHASQRMRLYRQGVLAGDYEVAFGQSAGRKRRQGDLRTPMGMYHVVSRYRGQIDGPYGDFYGGHWIKLNYPNGHDAEWGVGEGLVTRAQADAIARSWSRRELTDQSTPLGGGIGFHGWAEEWEAGSHGTALSWGCVVLHLRDIQALYDEIPVGAMVVIF